MILARPNCWTFYRGHKTSTLRSLINVGLRLLICTLFIQGYFLIREATFINFQSFFQEQYFILYKTYFEWEKLWFWYINIGFFFKTSHQWYFHVQKRGLYLLIFSSLWRATFIQEATFINFCNIIQGYVYLRGYVY